jgi:8-oxo-dGTP diphosphatase
MADSGQRQQPWVTVDVVVVAEGQEGPQVLLIRRKKPPFAGHWALPGGFVEPDEDLEAAARRELWEETGAEPAHLAQLHTFGAPGRDPRGWTISVVYLSRLEDRQAAGEGLAARSDAAEVGWFDLHQPPPLAFDHAEILAHARQRMGACKGSNP